MSKRDEYIARNRTMADAFLISAEFVPADVMARGSNVSDTLQSFARASNDNADWAEGLTNREFNLEPHKP